MSARDGTLAYWVIDTSGAGGTQSVRTLQLDGSGVSLVAETGDPIQDRAETLGGPGCTATDGANVAFLGALSSGTPAIFTNRGTDPGEALRTVAVSGEGLVYSSPTCPDISGERIVFTANTTGSVNAIFLEDSTGLRTIVEAGDPIPGDPLGRTFGVFFDPQIDGDFVAFRGSDQVYFHIDGLYILDLATGEVAPLITSDDALDGRDIHLSRILGPHGEPTKLDGHQLLFEPDFDGTSAGTDAIYLATFAFSSPVPALSAAWVWAVAFLFLVLGFAALRARKEVV